jgi:CheY-like chemotaxis protein
MASDRKKCLDAGMDEYMSKPIDFEQLFSLIDDYLQEGR